MIKTFRCPAHTKLLLVCLGAGFVSSCESANLSGGGILGASVGGIVGLGLCDATDMDTETCILTVLATATIGYSITSSVLDSPGVQDYLATEDGGVSHDIFVLRLENVVSESPIARAYFLEISNTSKVAFADAELSKEREVSTAIAERRIREMKDSRRERADSANQNDRDQLGEDDAFRFVPDVQSGPDPAIEIFRDYQNELIYGGAEITSG